MAINYTTLTGSKSTSGSIANWCNRGDLPTENILLEAEAWIYQRLRVREMVATTAFTFDADASTEALPDGFLDPVQFLPYEYAEALPFYHEEFFRAERDSSGDLFDGTPSKWTIIGTTAHVDVACSAAFSGILMYYATPAALSGGNETNFLTTRYPTALRRVCMAMAYEHMKDTERMNGEYLLAEAAIGAANALNEMARRGQHMPA